MWRRLPFLLACSLCLARLLPLAGAAEDNLPSVIEGDKKPSYPVEPTAAAFVARFDRRALLEDPVFLKALEDLARSDLTPEAQADAFALLQRQLGWLFSGAVRVFPKLGYAETQAQVLTTYFQYQEQLPKDLKVGPLLDLARTARAAHPLRGSNALLLATILNHNAAQEAVTKAIDLKLVESAPVPAIDLHNLCLAAALTRDPRVVAALLAFLPKIESEESREDLITMTAIYRDPALQTPIEDFVRARFPALFDQSIKTALRVLIHGSEINHFRAFYKSLGDGKAPEDVETLRKFWDSQFADPLRADVPGQSPLKLWDGFAFAVGQDGGWITFGAQYRAWVSFL